VSQRPTTVHKGRSAFRTLALAALLAAVGQVALGGIVRVTGSGLGCPDWPLCHGQIVPALQTETLIEYSHRLTAAILGILVLVTTAVAWRVSRDDLRVTVSSTLALALVIVAALLGGITVLTKLTWWVVLLHLGLAESVVACMTVALVFGWNAGGETTGGDVGNRETLWFDLLVVCALLSTFALVLSGSYMVGLGYGLACSTWPLCRGSVLPEGGASLVHMAHRFAAALVGMLIVGTALSAWSHRARSPRVFWVAFLAACIFVAQALVGAGMVWSGFTVSLRAVHLVMATLLWVSVVTLVVLNFRPRRFEPTGITEGLSRVSGLERVAP